MELKGLTWRQRAFTTIELITVIVILSILVALTVRPLFMDKNVATLSGEADRLLTDVRYVQSLSMFRNQRYRLNFSNNDSYSVLTPLGGTFNYLGITSITLTSGTTLTTSSSNKYLIFNGLGSPFSSTTSSGSGTAIGSNYTITLTNSSGSKTITVIPETGEAQVS